MILTAYSKQEECVQILSKFFTEFLQSNDFKISPYFLNPSERTLNYGRTSIIEDAAKKFSFPMIDFDNATNIAMIQSIFKAPACITRDKYNLVVNRGVGGGKTLALEELKMLLNCLSDTLAIAITYNSDWTFTKSEFTLFTSALFPLEINKSDFEKDYLIPTGLVFSIITRITSMIYGEAFLEVRRLLRLHLVSMPSIVQEQIPLVLVAFVKSIVEELRQTGRSITKVCFLIDETAKVNEEYVGKECAKDLWQTARNTLLGEGLEKYVNISTALVMSSLDYDVLSATDSGRRFQAIVLPERLNSTKIVTSLWEPPLSVYGNLTAEQKQDLERFAKACQQSPRTVEVFRNVLVEHRSQGGELDSAAYGGILAKALHSIGLTYPDVLTLPQGEYMLNLLYNISTYADNEVLELIRSGLYSNCITSFVQKKRPKIFPETSLVLLAAAATKDTTPIAKVILDLFDCFCQGYDSSNVGCLLENIVINTFKAKLICDATCPDSTTTFSKLLCVQGKRDVNRAPQLAILQSTLPKIPPESEFEEDVLLPSYNAGKQLQFYQALSNDKNMPTKKQPYTFFKADKTEQKANSFDFLFAAYTGEDSPPLIMFVECKSADVKDPSNKTLEGDLSLEHMPESGIQYNRTCTQLMEALPKGISETGLLRFIREWSWVYVYMVTHEKYTEPIVHNNCLLLGPEQVRSFMSQFQNMYEASRSILNSNRTTTDSKVVKIAPEKSKTSSKSKKRLAAAAAGGGGGEAANKVRATDSCAIHSSLTASHVYSEDSWGDIIIVMISELTYL